MTFSVQKSVTVLHASFEAQQVQAERTAERLTAALGAAAGAGSADPGELAELSRRRDDARVAAASWRAHRDAVEDEIWAGNRAALDYLSEHAGYSRVGHHGGTAGRFLDAHDWVIASFFQHDSSNHDPQLHIHNPILNRVQGSDGKWRTLDSKAIHKFRGAAAAVGERTTEEHLAQSLGLRVATRPDGTAREIVGMDQRAMDLFSFRRRAVTKKTAALVEAFEMRFRREPNSLELDRLQRQATLQNDERYLDAEEDAAFLAIMHANRDDLAAALTNLIARPNTDGPNWPTVETDDVPVSKPIPVLTQPARQDDSRTLEQEFADAIGDMSPATCT
ncbi:MobF family relaxase [Amycolatopsis sp. NPDC001319]|uniref:MobF family relaxase n=1 Tax=unclassified Amycolatopsis TaxID=2618356 RepID=UPI00369B61A1